MYSITGTSLIGVRKGTDGYWLEIVAPTAGMTIDTTESLYAIGCKCINIADGKNYYNTGTVASPVWTSLPANTDSQQLKTVSLTAANINGMYAAPVEIIPAITGKAIIVDSLEFVITRTATAFASGGAVQVQYDSTANAGGTAVSATIASTVVTGAAGTTYTARIPVVLSDVASASIVGKGLYISNATGAFTTGTGTASVIVRYHTV